MLLDTRGPANSADSLVRENPSPRILPSPHELEGGFASCAAAKVLLEIHYILPV